MDHDQLFKELIKEFVTEAVAEFLPWLEQRRLQPPQWPNTEVFSNPPLGRVLKLDLIVELSLRGAKKDSVVKRLLDIEFESATSLTEVRKKIGMYYPVLRHQSSKKVTILAFYLKVPLKGLGIDEYVEHEDKKAEDEEPPIDEPPARRKKRKKGEVFYRVRWRYVALPGLDAEKYLNSKNILAVVLCSLMRIAEQHKPEVKAEILRRIKEEFPDGSYRRHLLINVVESYLVLDGELLDTYQRLLQHEPKYKEIPDMMLTYADKLELKGKRETLQSVVIETARRQCGAPDDDSKAKLAQIEDVVRLERIFKAAFTAQSWEQLLATE